VSILEEGAGMSSETIENASLYAGPDTMEPHVRRRQLMAASIGNVLEYYDFVVYAFLAAIIARKFFPNESEVASLLASFAAFGVGFLARPLGGAIIGRIGDRSGRRVALLITIFGMAIGTVGIGALPTYAQIGVFAPIFLVAMRLLQGLSAGGEWGGATSFIAESAPKGRRGWFGGIGQASIASASLLGSIVTALVAMAFTPDQMQDWAWRVPFLLGGLLLPVGIYMRSNIEETPAFEASRNTAPMTPPEFGSPLAMMAKAFGFTIVWTVGYYVMLNYMPTFLTKFAGLSQSEALWGNAIALAVLVATTPLFGLFSDKIGRKPLLLACCAAFVILPYPVFSIILDKASFPTIVGLQILINLFIAAFSGAGPAALAELFPTHSRTLLMSVGYSLSVAIFGGFAPYIATWLIEWTGSPIAPTYYLIASGIISGFVIWSFRETAHQELR
jgi:MHS family proline/betaine transporter-like MFS transporter